MERLEGSADFIPVIRVPWQQYGKDAQVQYEDWLTNEISNSLQDRKDFDSKCDIWLKQYLSRSEYTQRSSDNTLDMPTTRKIFLQNAARVVNPVFAGSAGKLFVAQGIRSGAEQLEKVYENMIDFIVGKKRADFKNFGTAFYRQAQLYGLSIAKVGFTNEYESIMQIGQAGSELNKDSRVVSQLETGQTLVERRVLVNSGSFPQVVPIKDFLWPWHAISFETARWLGDASYYLPNEIAALEREQVFPPGTQAALGTPDSAGPQQADIKQSGFKRSKKSNYHRIAQIFASYDVNGDGYDEEVISYVDIGKSKVITTVFNYLKEKRRPYVKFTTDPREDQLPGYSLAFIIESQHRARSIVFQQRLDAATRANSIVLLIRKGADLLNHIKNRQLEPGVVETTMDLSKDSSDFRELKLSQPFTQLENLESQIENDALQVSYLSLLNLGQSTEDRPTAYGQQRMMQEAQFPINGVVDNFADALAEVVTMMLCRYAQFFPSGLPMLLQTINPEDRKIIEDLVEWPAGTITENIVVKTAVNSATLNRDMRMQEKQQLLAMMPQVYEVISGLATQATSPTPIAPAALRLLDNYTRLINEFIDEIHFLPEGMTPDVRQEVSQGVQIGQALQALQGQVQQLQQFIAQRLQPTLPTGNVQAQ